MATNEGDFKREFRSALEKEYGDSAKVWTNNDMFRSGLPDFCALYKGSFFAIEAKFVKAPPVRETSKLLDHELSPGQAEFLHGVKRTGCYGVVLVGLTDIAVAIPFSEWGFSSGVPNTNITLERVRLLSGHGLSFPKKGRIWDVSKFFEKVIACPTIPGSWS